MLSAPLIFYKDNANREQRHQTRLNGYAEMPFIFYKDKAIENFMLFKEVKHVNSSPDIFISRYFVLILRICNIQKWFQ